MYGYSINQKTRGKETGGEDNDCQENPGYKDNPGGQAEGGRQSSRSKAGFAEKIVRWYNLGNF